MGPYRARYPSSGRIKRQRRTNFWYKISRISYINYCCRNHSSPFTLLTRIPYKTRHADSGRGKQSSNGKCPWSKYKPSLHYCLWFGCCACRFGGLNGSPNNDCRNWDGRRNTDINLCGHSHRRCGFNPRSICSSTAGGIY